MRQTSLYGLPSVAPIDTAGLRSEHLEALRRSLERMPVIVFTVDLEMRLTYVAGGGIALVERAPEVEHVLGRSLYEIIGPVERDDRFAAAVRSALGGAGAQVRVRRFGRSYEVFLEPIFGADRTMTGIHIVALDQTESHANGRALRRSDASLNRAQRLAGVGSWVYDPATDELFVSEEMRRLFDLSDVESPDKRAFMRRMHPGDRGVVRESLITAAAQRRGGFGRDYRIVLGDGTLRWLRQTLEVTCDQRGRLTELSGTVLDITERKHQEEHLRKLAHFDVLTGLANRLNLSEQLERTLAANALEGVSTAVLFIDVDRFKTVNDTLGHAAGDILLTSISRRIQQCLRATDFMARVGGDEFVILLTLRAPEDAAHLASRINLACAAPVFIDERELFCSVSIGISTVPNDASTADEVLRNADTAMYVAKSAGRNAYRFFTPAMHAKSSEQLSLENDLRRAIERDELYLNYQPIVLADGTIASLEALVRWRHPSRGLLGPDVFVPIAEESGSIVALGLWVLRAACNELRVMRKIAPTLRLAVNLSARQFDDPGLLESFKNVLGNAGLEFCAVTFEITESVVMNDLEHAIRTLEALKELGARIAIDDFGTGYSSLAALKDLPIDTLKIDKSFIRDMPQDPGDVAIVTAIVGIGRALNLCVVAEGVETAEQLAYLRSIGCDAMQGYHISRPLASAAIAELLAAPPSSLP